MARRRTAQAELFSKLPSRSHPALNHPGPFALCREPVRLPASVLIIAVIDYRRYLVDEKVVPVRGSPETAVESQ